MFPAAVKFSRLFFQAGLALLFVFLPAKAFTYSTWLTRVWQIDDGLLDNNVNGIVQGPDHYLWLVTPVGLMQFDGNSFYPFPAEHFTGADASHVRILLPGRGGVLWMASDGGMVTELRSDLSTAQFAKGLPKPVPGSLAEDKNGALWLRYPNGIYRIEDGQVAKVTAKLPGGSFQSLASDGDGNIWLAKGNQVGFFENGQFHTVARESGTLYLAATQTNAIWMAAGNRLFCCGQNGTIRDCGVFQSASAPGTLALLEDHTGGVWIGTDGNGLFRYDQSHFERIETSHSSILSLAEDDEGDIWVGTGGGGLDRITRSGVQLDVVENNQVQAQIQSVCQDTNGVLWGATRNGDLLTRTRIGDHWEPALTNASFAGTVTCVAADRDAIWIGTQGGQLAKLDNPHDSVWETNLAQGAINGLLPTSGGDLWIVEGGALERMHDRTLEKVQVPRQLTRVFSIAEGADGNVWVGANGLLLRFNGTNMVNETSRLRIAGRSVCCLYGTSDGSMWIGSRGGGLMWFKKDHASRIGLNQGLVNNYISQIIADGSGWLWFASTRGIFKIRQQEVEQAMENHNVIVRPIVYGQNEGLASQEAVFSSAPPYVIPRAIGTRDGRVWMLMHTGIVVADPAILPNDPAPPPVVLTQVALDGQLIASRDGVGSTQTVATLGALVGPLQIPPSHRYLEFDFTAFHFRAPENVRFRYQLAGFDSDWIDAGPQRSATYSRLRSGNYQFRAEACVGDSPWSDSAATLAFTVDPYFWETWWFRAGVLLLFTSSIIVVVRYISTRRIRMQLAMIEQRAALDKERTRIARDLHDDLGCSLNKVALTLDMMQGDSSRSDSDTGEIRDCSLMIRNVAQSVDEIVWAINPRNDTLLYMVDYISQSAVEFLEAAGIPCVVEMPDNLPSRSVPPEVRHNLLLVVKEALNNIGRHAGATQVQLHINVSEDQIAIMLQDNGRGFERAPDNSSSDGLRNMRQRMEEIKGSFQIESRPGAGTRVVFQYAWHPKP